MVGQILLSCSKVFSLYKGLIIQLICQNILSIVSLQHFKVRSCLEKRKKEGEFLKKRGRESMGNVGEIEEIQWLSSSISTSPTTLPLLSLNHVSFVCKSVSKSVRFYEEVLGFVLIKRPSSFNFEGAWYAYYTAF